MSTWLIILWAIFLALQPSTCQNSAVCNTPACREVAAQFTASMKTTIDPCVNFYQYVCGRWPSANPKPKYRDAIWDNTERLQLLAETRLRDELQSAASSSDSQPIQQMKQFYKTCINGPTESDAITEIQKILRASGGWPMIMNINQSNADCRRWQGIDEYYSNILGNSTFYTIGLTGDYLSDNYAILIQYPLFYADLYKNRAAYRSLIKQIAETFIRENDEIVSDKQLDEDIDDLITFEDRLYTASGISDQIRQIGNVERSIEEWNKMTQNFPITRIKLDSILQRIFSITNLKPSARARISVKTLEYFTEVPRILQSTRKRTIINYIHWKSLSKILPYATRKIADLFYKIENDVKDIQKKPPRWMQCLNQIGQNYASYSLFIKKYYQENSRKAADDLYRRLLKSWQKQLDNFDWLSRKSKKTAQQKLDNLSAVLGNPIFYKDDKKINDYFAGLKIDNSYLRNTINFMNHGWKEQLKNWGKPGGSIESFNNPYEPRAFYKKSANTIEIGPIYLQSPLLDGTLPNYVTYGSLGSTLAHEISHTLDYEDFIKMLTASELTIYDEIVKCFIDIYDTYFRMAETIHGSFIKYPESRGKFTLNENIADWSGLQIAFRAYKKLKKEKLSNGEFKFPDFKDYTDEQMFFISYAKSWCNENLEDDVNDVHSPGYLRIIATVSNTPEFAGAFNCSRNTPMNPKKKCSIWTI